MIVVSSSDWTCFAVVVLYAAALVVVLVTKWTETFVGIYMLNGNGNEKKCFEN